jgi:uncharacterized protein YndB with AHSA1/START domain
MQPLEKKITISASVSRVWKALTIPEELEKWMLMTTDFSAEKGKEFIFRTDDPGENWDGIFHCKVLEVIENKKLVYTWNADFFNADTLVTIYLKEDKGRTELTLIHSGWEKLPVNNEETRKAHNEGWDVRFVQKLKEIAEL